MGFLNNIVNTFKKASRKRVELDKDTNTLQLLLDTEDEEYFTLSFDSVKVQTLYDPSVQEAYSIDGENSSLGLLYIEVIRLRPQHEWRVSAGSAFDLLIKQTFKASELRFVDSYEKDFFKLSKYQIDSEFEIGAIWFSLNNYEVFILDTKGQLFNDLLEIYKVKNKDMLITSLEAYEVRVDKSITSSNLIENYFGKE